MQMREWALPGVAATRDHLALPHGISHFDECALLSQVKISSNRPVSVFDKDVVLLKVNSVVIRVIFLHCHDDAATGGYNWCIDGHFEINRV
jgi:hypothetical protein